MNDVLRTGLALARRWAIPSLVGLVLLGVSLFFAWGVGDGDLSVQVAWPARLSATNPGKLIVSVQTRGPKTLVAAPGARVQLVQIDASTYLSQPRLAQLILKGDDQRVITEGVADDAGLVALTLPPVAREPQGAQLKRSDEGVRLVVRVDHDGDWRLLTRDYSSPPEVRLAMSTDRPLYQPGQAIRMRAMGVAPDNGAPVAGPLRWEVRDPRGNLVLKEQGALGPDGVAHIDMPLATRCLQGDYALKVFYGDIQAQTSVAVRPFRLPRFKVKVLVDKARVSPGEPVAGRVEALYTYGDPVADAEVTLEIDHARQTGRSEVARVEGRTDKDGVLRFAWSAPSDLRVGSTLSLNAVVDTEAGRAERGRAQLPVGAAEASVELLAADAQGWRYHSLNDGFVIVRDGRGRPMNGAKVTLKLPEARQERLVTLTLDEQGHGRFSWSPTTKTTPRVRIEIAPPEGPVIKRDLTLAVQYRSAAITTSLPVAKVGEPFEVTVHNARDARTLVAAQRGYTVAWQSFSGQSASRSVSLTFGPEARGQTTLYLTDKHGSVLAQRPIWVAQRGGDRVQIQGHEEAWRPGDDGTLSLSFPPAPPGEEGQGSGQGDGAPVTFSVVAVDEALYGLVERELPPLRVLLREPAERVAAIARALRDVDLEQDGIAGEIASARFGAALASVGSESLGGGQDLTLTARQEQRRPWAEGWGVLLVLGLLGMGAAASRATWRAISLSAFGWKRTGAVVGVGVVALIVAAIMAGMDGRVLLGGVMVWSGVVLCWLLAPVARGDQETIGPWLEALLGACLMLGLLALSLIQVRRLDGWFELTLMWVVGALIVVALVQALLWSFAMQRDGFQKAGLGLATIFGVIAGGAFGASLFMFAGMEGSAPTYYAEKSRSLESEDMPSEGKPSNAAARPPAGEGAPRVRAFFPETMIWMPSLASDEQGRAEVRFPIPDSITTWRVEATAASADGRFGDARVPLRVWQPFFVELELPTHLTDGDQVAIPVSLINNHDKALKVAVAARAQGALSVRAAPPSEVSLDAGARRLLTVMVDAEGLGAGALTITATPEGVSGDAVRREVTVSPDGRSLETSASGLIREGWSTTLAVPGRAIAGSASASAAIFPSAAADALDGLDGMLRAPRGCFEQTSSVTYPNVMILRALRQVSPEKWPGGKSAWEKAHRAARKFVAEGYQKMLTFQHGSGGFALYPPDSGRRWHQPDPMLTAYGLMQLHELATVYPVDPNVMARAARWLTAQQNAGGTWPVYAGRTPGGQWSQGDDAAQLRATAFIAWALLKTPTSAEHQEALKKALDHLAAETDETGAPDTLAWIVAALHAGGRQAPAVKAGDRLITQVSRQDDLVWWGSRAPSWMGARGRYADIEATALAAWALLTLERHGELLQPALRYLAQARSAYGGWGSTQATVWALRTFEKLRAIDSDGPVALTVRLQGEPWAEAVPQAGAQPGQVTLIPGDARVRRFYSGALDGGGRRVQISASRSTAAMARGSALFAVPWSAPEARVKGERLALGMTLDRASVARGDVVEAVLTVRNPSRDAYGALIVEAPVPPGAFVIQEPLEQLRESGLIDAFEVLPTHVRIYLPGLAPLDQRRFALRWRPLVRGEVSLPPVRGWLFYTPTPVTERDGGEMKVE